jgi:fido (protein-threonine AMPylation protein)
MKYVRKKVISGIPYYYFEYNLKTETGRVQYSKYLGKHLPSDLKDRIEGFFSDIARISHEKLNPETRDYFPPGGARKIEEHRFRYVCLNHELFEEEFKLFRNLFNILFMLNSNRAEGSRVTRPDIERVLKRRIKPKTLIDREIVNSVDALNFAFSRDFKWNLKSIKKVHRRLFHDIPGFEAGTFKKEDNIAGGGFKGLVSRTTPWKEVPREMKGLLEWFKEEKKKNTYPPILALKFHFRFEAIHPFLDGNGRVGRILLNAQLIEKGFMPVIFFSQNHRAYCNAISKAREGQEMNLAKHFVDHLVKTWRAVQEYKKEGIIKGGSPQIGEWEIQKGNIRVY